MRSPAEESSRHTGRHFSEIGGVVTVTETQQWTFLSVKNRSNWISIILATVFHIWAGQESAADDFLPINSFECSVMAVLCLFNSIQIACLCANVWFMTMYNHVVISKILDKYLLLTIKNDQMNAFHAKPRKHENAINPSSKWTEQEKWWINQMCQAASINNFPPPKSTWKMCAFITR